MHIDIMATNKQTLILYRVLGLLTLASLLAPSYQEVGFDEMKQQLSDASSSDAGCGKKDATLSSAETIRIKNIIDPEGPLGSSYKTISESIANIPDGSTKRYVLILKPGVVYREKVFISKSKPFVTIESENPYNPAVIVWNDTAATLGKDGKPLGVDGSSTVTVESDYFIAYGVVIKNDAPLSKPWSKNGEAPALRVMGTKATIYNCTIDGGRGALYDQMGRHYYKSNIIKGTVDFIFGHARSFYEDCRIISVEKNAVVLPVMDKQLEGSTKGGPGESGFSFKTCTIEGEGQRVFLGRVDIPTVYSYCNFHKVVLPIVSSLDNNIQIPVSGGYFGTFKCHMPELKGDPSMRAAIQSYGAAKPFIGTHFILGDSWIPSLPPNDE